MENDPTERLIAAIHEQTKAMQELADSNRAVVDLIITQQTDEGDDEPTTYLDGETMD